MQIAEQDHGGGIVAVISQFFEPVDDSGVSTLSRIRVEQEAGVAVSGIGAAEGCSLNIILGGFVQTLLDAFAGAMPRPADPELDQLTPREREVLRQIARGYTYKQVARRLSISIKTVESHVSAVLRKLQLSSRYELTRWATDRRIV